MLLLLKCYLLYVSVEALPWQVLLLYKKNSDRKTTNVFCHSLAL
jgi:hypothetical protein